MSEEFEKQLRETILPKIIDTSEMDIWHVDWMADGMDDFTSSAFRKCFKIQLVSKDLRIEMKIWLDRPTIEKL
jgi:hypothetical protein